MKRQTRERLVLPMLIPLLAFAVLGLLVYGFSRILLGVPVVKVGGIPNVAATVIAIAVALVVLLLSAAVASLKRIRLTHLFSVLAVVVGVALIASGVVTATVSEEEAVRAEGEEAAPGGEAGPQAFSIGAPPGASANGFDKTELTFPAGQVVRLTFDNREPGVPHNFAVYSEDPIQNPQAEVFFQGEIITGPATIVYEIEVPPPGEYFFRCDVHPTTMTGTLVVKEAMEEAGEAGEVTAEATGSIAAPVGAATAGFDRTELTIPAGQEVTVTFENQDAGVSHNLAVYAEDANANPNAELIAETEIEVGPVTQTLALPALEPREYFFRCDVHPTTMTGTLVVTG